MYGARNVVLKMMTNRTGIRLYSRADVSRILRLRDSDLSRWEAQGLIEYSDDYSFFHLLKLKELRDRLATGVSPVRARGVISFEHGARQIPDQITFSQPHVPSLTIDRGDDIYRPDGGEDTILPVTFDFKASQFSQIVSVTSDFSRLLHQAKWDLTELLQLTPRQFEEVVAEIWTRLGYETQLTAKTRDGGRDIIAVRRSEANLRFLIECKRYAPPNKVGVELVRALYGVVCDERATKGILATTSSFTSTAEDFVAEHVWELELRDYKGIADWISRVQKDV